MGMQLDFITIALAVIIGVAGHLALAFSARWLNPLWTLAAAYFLLVPLSMAEELPGFQIFKYARVYVCLLAILTAVFIMREYRLRSAGGAFLAFSAYYVLAAMYGPSPINGVQFKALYLYTVIAGILAVYSVSGIESLRMSMRVVVLFGGVFGAIIVAKLILNPLSITRVGRFMPLGMNSNRVGQEAAATLLCCCAVALHDRNKVFKIIAVGVGTALVLGILASGSRAAAGMGLIGAVVMGVPMARRPGLLISLAAVSAGLIYFMLPDGTNLEGFTGRDLNNRGGEWGIAMSHFLDNPLIGAGWVFDQGQRLSGSTSNMHSIYMQILAETGLLGMIFFGLMVLWGVSRGLAAIRATRHDREVFPWVFVAGGFCAATLAHGTAESSTIMGSAINAMILAMGFALLDRLPEIARERAAAAEEWAEWEESEAASAEQHEQQQLPVYAPVPV